MTYLGKTRIKKWFLLVVGPLKGGGDPWTTKKKRKKFFYWKKIPEPHETQENLIKKYWKLCSVLVNIDEQKNVIRILTEKILFQNLSLIEFFLLVFYPF